MSYSVCIDNEKDRYNIQLINQILGTTGDNKWYINDSKNEIQSDNDDISVETIKINYCNVWKKVNLIIHIKKQGNKNV